MTWLDSSSFTRERRAIRVPADPGTGERHRRVRFGDGSPAPSGHTCVRYREDDLRGDFSYVRLHGPSERKYQGSYPEEALRRWARWIRAESRRLRAIWVFFDNDQEGYAPRNALELKRLLRLRS
ncbi:MAG TPA: DUF72 domain-containing protein [Thermoanaerobaculia bacterium]|nr:DUF72 domain-containing protein [Thermoanaerobaculia bacterium]